MKKRFILFVSAFAFLVLLSACNKNISNEENLTSNADLNNTIVKQESLQNPEIKIENVTGSIIDGDNIDGIYYKDVLGYRYTYYYKDLGIEIISSDIEDIFLNKLTGEIFSRSGNMIYFGSGLDMEYLWIHEKDSNISLEDEVLNKYMMKGCKLYTGTFEIGSPFSGLYYVAMESLDGNVGICNISQRFPDNVNFVSFVMDTKFPNKYIEAALGDACAPGPCSLFGEIKFR